MNESFVPGEAAYGSGVHTGRGRGGVGGGPDRGPGMKARIPGWPWKSAEWC